MRVLVLDGHVNPAVAAVRSLARAGYRAYVGSTSPLSKAGWSRFSSGKFTYPSASKDAQAFAESVAATAAREKGTFVLPLSERTTLAVSAHRALIERVGGRVVLPPHSILLRAYDKHYTTCLATRLGVAAPKTWLLSCPNQAEQLAPDFRYPAALKARTSEEFREGALRPTMRTRYARDSSEFLAGYQQLRQSCDAVLAQEFVDGDGVLYGALLSRGELRAEFAYKRVRAVHPTGWGAALRVSVPCDTLREQSLSILRSLDPTWTGLGQVEYRVRRGDDVPFFLEVNPRSWHSMPLAVYAGVDFLVMLAHMAEQGDVPPHLGYPAGVMCRWWLGDFRHLVYLWLGAASNYPLPLPGRLQSLLHFLTPTKGTYHDNFNLDDPLPELGEWLAAGIRTVQRATGRVPLV